MILQFIVRRMKNVQISESREGEVITLMIGGRVDTNTSPEFQEAILKSFQKVNQVVLDFQNCTYVSSAGLRVLLVGQKTAGSKSGMMKLVHVPEMLMSVLKLSGFSKFLTIE